MAYDITRRPVDIRYQHADDGKLYEHKFSKGTHIRLNPDGTFTGYNVAGKPTHTVRDGQGFFLNPPDSPPSRRRAMRQHRNAKGQFTRGNPGRRKRRRGGSNPPRRRATTARNPKHRKRRTSHNPPRARARRRGTRSNPYVVTHRVTEVPNPPHRRRRARKNPPEGMAKALGMEILANAGWAGVVLVGQFTATNVPTWVNTLVGGRLPNNFFVNAAFELLTAVAGGVGLSFVKPELGAMWMIGGFVSMYRSVLTGFAIPFVSTGLSGVTDRTAVSLRGYVAARRAATNGDAATTKRRVAGYTGSPLAVSAGGPMHQQGGQQ